MKPVLTPPTMARERLHWIARYSQPYRRELHGPRYLIAPALLAILLLVVILAIAVGSAAAEMFGLYAGWLKSLTAPYS